MLAAILILNALYKAGWKQSIYTLGLGPISQGVYKDRYTKMLGFW